MKPPATSWGFLVFNPDPDGEKIQLIFYVDHVEQRATSAITSIAAHSFWGDPHGDPDKRGIWIMWNNKLTQL